MKIERIFAYAPGDLANNRASFELHDESEDGKGLSMMEFEEPREVHLDTHSGVRYILNLAHWAAIEYHFAKE